MQKLLCFKKNTVNKPVKLLLWFKKSTFFLVLTCFGHVPLCSFALLVFPLIYLVNGIAKRISIVIRLYRRHTAHPGLKPFITRIHKVSGSLSSLRAHKSRKLAVRMWQHTLRDSSTPGRRGIKILTGPQSPKQRPIESRPLPSPGLYCSRTLHFTPHYRVASPSQTLQIPLPPHKRVRSIHSRYTVTAAHLNDRQCI